MPHRATTQMMHGGFKHSPALTRAIAINATFRRWMRINNTAACGGFHNHRGIAVDTGHARNI
ncbi:MAG: hypothetical protein KJ970_10535 [Candidatus Eisenbacteria bacterium]|uniref:Uncharacterized protein n=1 Tax=Eiseniibacteriota bacterium TaxID=2212470 RepID=A0A948RUZ5_UNCEI|nr:hypothetical protein [Candidatus Eisenbacteria bacterium]